MSRRTGTVRNEQDIMAPTHALVTWYSTSLDNEPRRPLDADQVPERKAPVTTAVACIPVVNIVLIGWSELLSDGTICWSRKYENSEEKE